MSRKRNLINVEGQTFGKLMALSVVLRPAEKTRWLCACLCGRTVEVRITSLLNGDVQSCGCLKTKHGMCRTTEFRIWQGMIRRCIDPKHPHFKHYGGRGIRICDEWRHDFKSFIGHVGSRPSMTYTLDRINNDGHYEPGNVRWATRQEQAANRTQSKMLRYSSLDGKKLSIRQMARELAMPHRNLRYLLDRAEK